jgi:pimeloyl-ACP methyl ester carboxylesterase
VNDFMATARERDAALEPIDWAELPKGVDRQTFEAPSGTHALIRAGNATRERVVLIPGLTGSKEDFQRMMPLFVEAGYFVESYDLAGQYESCVAGPENLTPPRKRYDMDLFVDDMIAFLERYPGPSHVLGYSFAGTVAQVAYARRPDLFLSIAFLSAPPSPGNAFAGIKRIGWISRFVSGRTGGALMIWGVKKNIIPAPPERLEFVRARFELTRRDSVGDMIGAMMNHPDLRTELREARIPKIVMVGEHDLWRRDEHAAFAQSIGADFVVYATGHSPCEFTPHQATRDLINLYQRDGGGDDRSVILPSS